jgi:biopolymer transport protein ExbB
MKVRNNIGPALLASVFVGLLFAAPAQAQECGTANLLEILKCVEGGQARDNAEHRARLEEFRSQQAQQTQLLEAAQQDKARQEAISAQRETAYDENDLLITDVQAQLAERLGSLVELFGVLQQVAGDARSTFENSLTNIEFPDRSQFLSELAEKMGSTSELPSITEIERLWYELQREATEVGRIKRLPAFTVRNTQGEFYETDIVRVGPFNLVADGLYLEHIADTNSVSELQRQPSQARFLDSTSGIIDAQPGDGLVRFGIDITRGQLLRLLIQDPGVLSIERFTQGGAPGYVILILGAIGLLLALERMITLGITGSKVRSQLKSDTPKKNNPLGRVLSVYQENKSVDTETLELKLGEAILKESPSLQRGILFIKIISVVAPLLGLLGTVVGMINTFQAIMLYGAGDASRMAGGISQALVTTMLGLIVAIPMVLLHTIVNGRSRRILQILQEQSAGIVAGQSERTGS